MAVFPDKIVLKNSVDSAASILSQITYNGTAPIVPGEIVIGRAAGSITFYSVDSSGNIQSVSSGAVAKLEDLSDVTLTQSNGTLFQFSVDSGQATKIGYFNPNLNSAYNYTGMRTYANGTSSFLGGASSTDRTCWTAIPGGYSYFSRDPGSSTGTAPTSYTIRVQTTNTAGDAVNYQSAPTLGSGTSDLVVPTMGQVRAYADSVAGGGNISLDGLQDVTITSATNGQALVYNGTAWVNGAVSTVGSINDLTDVDTATIVPSAGQALVWDGVKWVPGNVSGGGGSGSISNGRVSSSGTAASGLLTLTGLGVSGQLQKITSTLDAWIVVYGSAADRTADASRGFSTDPAQGSGVQAEFYVAANTTVLATPGSTYFNNDTSPTEAVYLAVRSQGGSAVDATVTITAYAELTYSGVSGGTFGSG